MSIYKTILKSAKVLSTATLSTMLLNLLGFPILTIFYSPSIYGAYGLFLSISGIFAICSSLRLDLSILSIDSEEELGQLLCISCLLILIVSIIGAVFMFFWSADSKKIYALISFTYCFTYGINTLVVNYAIRKKKYKHAAYTNFFSVLFTLVIQIALSKTVVCEWGLFLGYILSYASVNYISGKKIRIWILIYQNFRERSFSLIDIYKKNSRLSLANSGQSLVGAVSAAVMAYFVYILGGLDSVAYYTFILRVMEFPVRIIGLSLKNVLITNFLNISTERAKVVAINFTLLLIITSIAIFTTLNIMLPKITPLVLGESWLGAEKYVLPISIWVSVTIIFIPSVSFLNYTGNVLPHFYYESSNLFMRTILCLIALTHKLDVITFLLISSLFTFLFGIILCFFVLNDFTGQQTFDDNKFQEF